MMTLWILTRRNVKLFFKDKGLFFTSLITPLILLVLYATFLSNVYRDSFASGMPEGVIVPDAILDGCVGGMLISSLLSVSCVTVAFCSNMLMVQDKVNGSRGDLTVAPVKSSTLSLAYYAASLFSTLLICFVALAAGLCYIASLGWYLSLADVFLLVADVLLLVLFGTALSSVVNFFLSSQGQISAVGSIISSCYGFICGAYMPISSFPVGLQKVVSFLPGTYGTSLFRNHALRGVFAEMESVGVPKEAVSELRSLLDCDLTLLGRDVSLPAMFLILGITVAVLLGVYILLNACYGKKKA